MRVFLERNYPGQRNYSGNDCAASQLNALKLLRSMSDFASRWQEELLQSEDGALLPAIRFGLDDIIVQADMTLALLFLPVELSGRDKFYENIQIMQSGLFDRITIDPVIYHAFTLIFGVALNENEF